jgi:hypothetical protein
MVKKPKKLACRARGIATLPRAIKGFELLGANSKIFYYE